jgi:hypothetical protein
MMETRIPVQNIDFEGHRARIDAIYEPNETGRFHFVKFDLVEAKRRGRPPGARRPRKPGPKPGRKRKGANMAKAAE